MLINDAFFAACKTEGGLYFCYGLSLNEAIRPASKPFEPGNLDMQLIGGDKPLVVFYNVQTNLTETVSKDYFAATLPKLKQLTEETISNEVIPDWFATLDKFHLLRKMDDGTSSIVGIVVIASEDKIFTINSDGQVQECYNFYASGEEADFLGDRLQSTFSPNELVDMVKSDNRMFLDGQWITMPTISGYLSAKSLTYEGMNGKKRQIKGGDFLWH